MHPLTPNFAELNDEQLLAKINDLYKRLKQAYGMNNPQFGQQLRMLLDDYQTEYNRRMSAAAEKFAQSNKKLSEKIDIE